MKMPSVALTFEGGLAELCGSWLMLARAKDFYKVVLPLLHLHGGSGVGLWLWWASMVLVWASMVLVWVSGSGVGLWLWWVLMVLVWALMALAWASMALAWVSGSGVGLWLCFLGAWRTVCFTGMCLGVRCSGVIVSGAQTPLSVSSAPSALSGFPGPRVPCLALSPGTGCRGRPTPLPLPTPAPSCPLADALLTSWVLPACVAPAELSSKLVLPWALCNVPFFPGTILSFSPFLS